VPRDMRRAGISGRVEIEDPRVSPTMLLNDSYRERVFTKEELKDLKKIYRDGI